MSRKEERDYYNASVTTKFTRNLYDALDLYSNDEEILLPKDIIIRLAVEEYLKKNYRKISNSYTKISVSFLLNDEFIPRKNSKDEIAYNEMMGIDDNECVKQFRVIS